MELGSQRLVRFFNAAVPVAVALVLSIASHGRPSAWAGGFGGQRGGAVGGVMIDGEGVVRNASTEELADYANRIRAILDDPSGDLNEASELRVVSLRGLQDAIRESREKGQPIPDEASLLAGLQRIEYVFVDQERRDILIAGPAEPWELRQDGSIVGTVSGRTTLRLDDLAVAIQSVQSARDGGITCSIEPTPEGRRNLQKMLARIVIRQGQNPSHLVPAMREAFGPQQVKLSGVPGESRMARTLVAADFEMKRLAMGLVDSPVRGLPSYLEMSKNSRHSGAQNPRWWMACDYDELKRSDDGLAWRITGQGVKALTDNDLIDAQGNASAAGRIDKVAQRWAKLLTNEYNDLAKSMPVFADLRNTMDLNVVATLIVQEQLAEKAGLDLTILSADKDTMNMGSYFVPEQIPAHCSFIQGAGGWIVTASGGVDINAFEVVQRQATDESVADARTEALASADQNRWWWNQ